MRINFVFILFIVGVLFITTGYAKQMKPSCVDGVEVKFIPRSVYDEISQGTAFTESDDKINMNKKYGMGPMSGINAYVEGEGE